MTDNLFQHSKEPSDPAGALCDGCGAEDEAALAWFVRLRREPAPSAAVQAGFAQWIAADSANGERFAAVAQAWRVTEPVAARLADDCQPALAAALRRMDAVKPPRRRLFSRCWPFSLRAPISLRAPTRAALACGGAFVLLGLAVVSLDRPHLWRDLAADYVTLRGEQRMVSLPDGSTMMLDADSAADIDFNADARQIRLLRGRAFFAVTPGDRQFAVITPDGRAEVKGTKFEVNRHQAGAEVTVAEGCVVVRQPDGRRETLTAGRRVRFGSGWMGPATDVDLTAVAGWRGGRLVFDNAPLAEVVAEIARYHQGRVIILSQKLAEKRISGNFPANNAPAALAALQAVLGFQLDDIAGKLILLR